MLPTTQKNLYIHLLCCLSDTNHSLATLAYKFFMVKFVISLEFYRVLMNLNCVEQVRENKNNILSSDFRNTTKSLQINVTINVMSATQKFTKILQTTYKLMSVISICKGYVGKFVVFSNNIIDLNYIL